MLPCINRAGAEHRGDGIARSYGFRYDGAGRLTSAEFTQQNKGSVDWTADKVDYSVSGLSYDAGGNILSMTQTGLKLGAIQTIDELTYTYFANSNRLKKVADAVTGTSTLGDFTDTTAVTDDYDYDANGNVVRDNNRRMHTASGAGAVYNLLDRPDSIVTAGKNKVYYTYDAAGARLAKKVNDYTSGTLVAHEYLYIGGFVYKNDTLQYLLTEEGRIRRAQKNGSTGSPYQVYEWDYFLRDHLGNVRTVLTEGKDTSVYVATMEPARQTVEDALFANCYTPVNTQAAKPSGFDSDTANHKVSHLVGGTRPIGPALVLKVMKGDRVDMSVYTGYTYPSNTYTSGHTSAADLVSLLMPGLATVSGGKVLLSDAGELTAPLESALDAFLTVQNENVSDPLTMNAYLNWVLLDNQFNFVEEGSGFTQVPYMTSIDKQAMSPGQQTMPQSGYLYIYLNNESNADVYFDDLTVRHYTGPLLQEQSYYPFGLTMAGISDRALNKLACAYKFNGGVELDEETGFYNTFYRQYDQQIGRFGGVDPQAEAQTATGPFHFGYNDPIGYNDPLGDLAGHVDRNGNGWVGRGVLWGLGQNKYETENLGDGVGYFDMMTAVYGEGYFNHGGGSGGVNSMPLETAVAYLLGSDYGGRWSPSDHSVSFFNDNATALAYGKQYADQFGLSTYSMASPEESKLSKGKNALNILKSFIAVDKRKTLAGQILQLISRFTWELPQQLVAVFTHEVRNLFGAVSNTYFVNGMLVVESKKEEGPFYTFGNVVAVPLKYTKGDIAHEYGHYIQSRIFGPLYLIGFAIPSGTRYFFWQVYGNPDNYESGFYTEKWAGVWGRKYW